MSDLVIRWIAGLAVALVGGGIFVEIFSRLVPPKPKKIKGGVPFSLTGHIERAFFAPLVGAGAFGFVVPMMLGWLTLKMAANWARPLSGDVSQGYQLEHKQKSIKALLCGFISMGFALLGGLICAGKLPQYFMN